MLSICIVNWNNRDYLRECLASIRQCPSSRMEIEVIVVDNASGDGSGRMIATEFPDVRLVARAENTGYARGNNIALEAIRGEYALLLNPDTRLLPGALDEALACFTGEPSVGAASVLFRNPDGTVQPSLRGLPRPEALLWEVSGVSRLLKSSRRTGAYFMRWFRYDREIDAEQPMGTFLMLSRAALNDVGLLDEEFPIFFNEVDWCERAIAKGWRVRFTPSGEIVHYGGQGTRLAPKAAMVRESHDSLLRYYEKHYRAELHPLLYGVIAAAIAFSRAAMLLRAR